jgi:hypothetical protein
MEDKETKARKALNELGLRLADQWASGFQDKPTQQLILQKIIDPAVKHILQTISPWIIGMAILFLVLITCTVITCIIVLRGPAGSVLTMQGPMQGPMQGSAVLGQIASLLG